MSAQRTPGMKQFLVTVPGEVLDSGSDVQILVSDWEGNDPEASFRSSTDHAVPWRPVEMVGGKVERA